MITPKIQNPVNIGLNELPLKTNQANRLGGDLPDQV
jgi:hypothetical protein